MHTHRHTTDGSARPITAATTPRPRARLLAGAAVALAGLLGSIGAASAAPEATQAPAAAPPSCVDSYSWFGTVFQYVGIDNNCGSTQRVKVVVSGGPDSRCYSIAPGGHVEHLIPWGDWDTNVRC